MMRVLLINAVVAAVIQGISFRIFLSAITATEGNSIIKVRNLILSDFYTE